jgi:UDP-N-acetylglucosamine/UDP-N-acetylgalactosamine diphosphorylase
MSIQKLSERYESARKKLDEVGLSSALRFWAELDPARKESLLEQVEELDMEFLRQTRSLRWPPAEEHAENLDGLTPLPHIPLPETEAEQREWSEARERGESLLREGAVAVLVVAGGQGTRLGYPGPKGKFVVGPVSGRTLFQYHVEKIRALERRFGRIIPFYVMTSPANHLETAEYFREQAFFGKDPESVVLFPQRMLPVFDQSGRLLLETPARLSLSPDGHGGLLHALRRYAITDDLQRRGIRHLYYFQVDNVLAQIADPVFVGFHDQMAAEMSAKTVYKRDPWEKLGNIGRLDGKYKVIEYTELPEEKKKAVGGDGKLLFGQGSIAIHLFAVDFLRRLAANHIELPYHIARKKMSSVADQGAERVPDHLNAIKFEQFIFDAFSHAGRVMVLETERRREFSPIKNRDGEDSPATARRDLSEMFAAWLEETGRRPLRQPGGELAVAVEISPLYAMSPGELAPRLPAGLELSQPILLEE